MTNLKNTMLIVGIFFLFVSVSIGQDFDNKLPIIDKELLKQDFSIFRTNLEKTHPALYRYKSESEISHLFDSCFQELNRDMAEMDFYAKIKFMLSAIEDGHLSSSTSAELLNYCEVKAKIFPIKTEFINNKAFVFCENNNSIPTGSELLEINDETIENIRFILYQYIVSDGSIQTKKEKILSNNFWFYYLLVYGEKPTFKIKFASPKGEIGTIDLPSRSKKNIDCKPDVFQTAKNLCLSFEPESTACLTIKTFNSETLRENKEDFADFLKSSFTELNKEKIKNLIIDLRGNGGGSDVYGSLLYSYLVDTPFHYYKSLSSKDKTFSSDDHPNLKIQKPSENSFSGKVYFLINGLSFSTTSEFCSIAKSNKRGVFIGKETGGGYYGNNSGDFTDVLLPNTKIVVSIPTTKYVMDVEETFFRDRGIIPDFEVEPSINDVLNNQDIQLEFALQLIDKNNSR